MTYSFLKKKEDSKNSNVKLNNNKPTETNKFLENTKFSSKEIIYFDLQSTFFLNSIT